ncbi:Mini-ribonuclease 3 [Natranaerobius trueperi]|uniref:Mini-ribonuclease 3 n=1 Tax=Natranaerobius trueperi TaxID=759412 RepID=A0A226C037_9FIRM|nr:Mini-ribonuclease 3 [Natranaerobius trueperi]
MFFSGEHPNLTSHEAKQYSPQVLAYLGDAVFELYVRTLNAQTPYNSLKNLHQETVQVVSATSQAKILEKLIPELTEEEYQIIRRGKNAKMHQPPKGADFYEYRQSTAFEALIGYLYLCNQKERIIELLQPDLLFGRGAKNEG